MLFSFYIVDSYAVVRNSSEKPTYPVPPILTSWETIVQYHMQYVGSDTLKIKHTLNPARVPPAVLSQTHTLPPTQPPPWTLPTPNLFFLSVIGCSSQNFYVHGVTQYVTFGDWLFSLSIMPWRFSQVSVCISRFSS